VKPRVMTKVACLAESLAVLKVRWFSIWANRRAINRLRGRLLDDRLLGW